MKPQDLFEKKPAYMKPSKPEKHTFPKGTPYVPGQSAEELNTAAAAKLPPEPEPKPVKSSGSAMLQGIGKAEPQTKPEHNTIHIDTSTFDGFTDDAEIAGNEELRPSGSKVANKAYESGTGKFNDNTILLNTDDNVAYVVEGCLTFPLINDSTHQLSKTYEIVSGKNVITLNLYDAFSSMSHASQQDIIDEINQFETKKQPDVVLHPYEADVVGYRSGSKGKYNIMYANSAALNQEIAQAAQILNQAYKGLPLVRSGDSPIHWVNQNNGATGFAISNWVIVPYDTIKDQKGSDFTNYLRNENTQHIVFGYYDTAGLFVNTDNPKQVYPGFTIGLIENKIKAYGIGAKSLRRVSALRPSNVFKDNVSDTFKHFDQNLKGTVLQNPYQDLLKKIDANFKNPAKANKLKQIAQQIVGTSSSDSISYPVLLDTLSIDETGMSTNAVAVDFFETLHPLAAMNKSAITDNGLYDAAAVYLGTTNFKGCKVFYPYAENAPLYDSMIISPDGKRSLMISSKGQGGALPSATGMASLLNTLLSNINDETIPPDVRKRIKSEVQSNADYINLVELMGVLNTDEANSIKFSSGSVKRVADALKAVKTKNNKAYSERVANEINELDNGAFVKFCTTVLNCTNLVQINSYYEEQRDGGVLAVDRFLATWPNVLYDNIGFSFIGTRLHFGVKLGAADTGSDFSAYQGLDDTGKKVTKQRFAAPNLINTLIVPGSKLLPNRNADIKWSMFVKDLYSLYTTIKKDFDDEFFQKVEAQNKGLDKLYKAAINFQSRHGYDPEALQAQRDVLKQETGMTITQLLDAIKELIT